jgi:hypothetical protein
LTLPHPESSPTQSPNSDPPKQINRIRKTKEQIDKAAKLIAEGSPIMPALMQSGWTRAGANRGKAALSGRLINAIAKKGVHLSELGRQALADPKAAEAVIMGRLMLNATMGKDEGVQSAKLAGSHRSINCFVPDNTVAVQVNVSTLDSLDDDSLITTPTT